MRPLPLAVVISALIAIPTLGHAQEPPAPATSSPATPATSAPASAPAAAPAPEPPAAAAPAEQPVPWDRLRPVTVGEDKPELHTGFAMNLGIGLPIPFGDVSQGDSLSKLLTIQFPSVALEVGANVTRSLFVGAYGTYGLGETGKSSPACQQATEVTCSAHSFRAGVTVGYRWLLGEMLRPWVGYGIGYEWEDTSYKSVVPGLNGKVDFNGWEFGHFKVGMDVQATPAFGMGPYLDLGIGKYQNLNGEVGGVTVNSLNGTAVHEWLTLGFRAAFGP